MKCAMCNAEFNDGVQCGSCKKRLDFGCANISESGWRKLGADRRTVWKCPSCRMTSPAAPASGHETISLETIYREIRDIKLKLNDLPSLIEDIKSIKEEIRDLKSSCEFNSAKVDEFSGRLSEFECRLKDVNTAHHSIESFRGDIVDARLEINALEQRSRLNNIEIKGVPQKKGEDLFAILRRIGDSVDHKITNSQINYISRVPSSSKEKPIIVNFLNRYVKEDFVAAARAVKNLNADAIGFQGSSQSIFLNDHLNAESKKLLNKVKVLAKEKNYKFVWVKFGKIHVRKNDSSNVFIINNEKNLNKIS